MNLRFTFGLASDKCFFVCLNLQDAQAPSESQCPILTSFSDENVFLTHVIDAELPSEDTFHLVAAVLTSISEPVSPPNALDLDLSLAQLQGLRLRFPPALQAEPSSARDTTSFHLPNGGSPPELYELLMEAPTPLAMLSGPDHRFTFLNKSWAKLIGEGMATWVMGRPIGECFPQVQEQNFVDVLDRVYRTGVPFHGTDLRCSFYRERSGTVEEGYFDTSYLPVRDPAGEITGLLAQTLEVTEQVLARAVRDHRESLLFRQWAELEAIYHNAPIGLSLIDAWTLRILRMNQRQAEMIGGTKIELLGKSFSESASHVPQLVEELILIVAGQAATSPTVRVERESASGRTRHWLVNYAPIYSERGQIEAVTIASFELQPDTPTALPAQLEDAEVQTS